MSGELDDDDLSCFVFVWRAFVVCLSFRGGIYTWMDREDVQHSGTGCLYLANKEKIDTIAKVPWRTEIYNWGARRYFVLSDVASAVRFDGSVRYSAILNHSREASSSDNLCKYLVT